MPQKRERIPLKSRQTATRTAHPLPQITPEKGEPSSPMVLNNNIPATAKLDQVTITTSRLTNPPLAGKNAAADLDRATPPLTEKTGTSFMDRAAQEILAVTYWYDPEPLPGPYPLTVKFSGTRQGVSGVAQPGDQFVQYETIDAVVPGSGPIALTATIRDVNPGEWAVKVQVAPTTRAALRAKKQHGAVVAQPTADPAPWLPRLWHAWAPNAGTDDHAHPPMKTCLAPFARVPGVLPGAWIAFVLVGIVLALVLQSLVISSDHLALGPITIIDASVLGAGFVGAKLWYMIKHRGWIGWCIQGFTTGATLASLIILLSYRLPIGVFLDATAPGMFLGMAVGRVGCFFGGCCGGPATAARWGIWSSDQRIGARRVPTQLLEAAFTAILGGLALLVVLKHGPISGAIFAASLAAYILGRQVVLRLRAEPTKKSLRVPVTTALAAAMFVASLAIIVFHAQ